jgi:rhamnosyltransferase
MTPNILHHNVPVRPDRKPAIAGVVVLYHPPEEVLENIRSYLGQVDVLFVVDNSEAARPGFTDQLTGSGKIVYIANGQNLGVAQALNIGASLALEHGCDFLLTMDQDSWATPDMVDILLDCLGSSAGKPVGIISPFHATRPDEHHAGKEDCLDILTVMTSGNLLNLEAYRIVGPFMDPLFIDFIDIEYCLRLRKNGFRVMLANRAILRHQVGNKLKFRLFSRDLYLTSHDALRKYYKTRNRFIVSARYKAEFPKFCRADRTRFILELLRLLFFERDRIKKLSMMWKGYTDYRHGRWGKFQSDNGVQPR